MKNKLLKGLKLFYASSEIERKPRLKPLIILSYLSIFLCMVILFFVIIGVLNSFGWVFLTFGLKKVIDGFEKYFNKEKIVDILIEFAKSICFIIIFLIFKGIV